MQLINILRSAHIITDLSVIYVGDDYLLNADLNSHEDIQCHQVASNGYDGQSGYDVVIFDDINHYETAIKIANYECLPIIFIAGSKPLKKEQGYIAANKMGINKIVATSIDLYDEWYTEIGPIFNSKNKESINTCLTI